MKRKPQPRCRCGHAKSKHGQYYLSDGWGNLDPKSGVCCYCFDRCKDFVQDNLKTLERLYEYKKGQKVSV